MILPSSRFFACKYYFYAPSKQPQRKGFKLQRFRFIFCTFPISLLPCLILFEFVRFFYSLPSIRGKKYNQKIIFSTISDRHTYTRPLFDRAGDVFLLSQPQISSKNNTERHWWWFPKNPGWSIDQIIIEWICFNEMVQNIHLSTIMSLCYPRMLPHFIFSSGNLLVWQALSFSFNLFRCH